VTSLGSWLRRLSYGLLVFVVALTAMTLRAVREGDAALEASDTAFHKGDLAGATLEARRAALAYAPGAPHTRLAMARLRAIAVGSEGAGDPETARLAWGAIRAAALGARHVTVPYSTELEEANQALARSMVPPAVVDPASRAKAEAAARQALAVTPGPSPWAALPLLVGAALAAIGLFLVATRGVTRDGRILTRGLVLGLAVLTLGAACWTFAAYRA
jgi:hypothetical protein